MKSIQFQEIIECSSQKSILTGQAGFGIRTYTESLDAESARAICEQANCAYEVDITEQVTAEEIEKDAQIVKKYPRTLKYTTIKDENGQEKFIIACTTYIGIDYGYFCQVNAAKRAGSNYLADILIFEERPTAGLFDALIQQKIFLPIDNTCSPDNTELQMLLTGEPSYLQPRSVNIPEATDPTTEINELTATMAMLFLQVNINEKLHKEQSLRNIILQADEDKVPTILKSWAALPSYLVEDKYFQTNYLQGYGMPNGYRLIFLNEHNKQEVYTDHYIYMNVNDKTFKNVDTDNFYFKEIQNAAHAKDYPLFQSLINYLYQSQIAESTDYQELYHLFLITRNYAKCHPEVMPTLRPISKEYLMKEGPSLIVEYLEANQYDEISLSVLQPLLKRFFQKLMDKDNQEGIEALKKLVEKIGEEKFTNLQLVPLLNDYANYCFLHPRKTNLSCAHDFLTSGIQLSEEAETYFEIIYRLNKNPQNLSGSFWELIIAKRLNLPMKEVRMPILKRFLCPKALAKSFDHKALLHDLKDYMTDAYSPMSEEKKKEEAQMIIDCIWEIFKGQQATCEELTLAIIDTARWSSQDQKAYLAHTQSVEAKDFISKHYSLWSSLKRKLFKK